MAQDGEFMYKEVLFQWAAKDKSLSFISGTAQVKICNGFLSNHIKVWIDGLDIGIFTGDTEDIEDNKLRKTIEFGIEAWISTYLSSKAANIAKLAN
jgi:hypothetical protein